MNGKTYRTFRYWRLLALSVLPWALWASGVHAQTAPISNLAASLSVDLLDADGVPIPPDERVYQVRLSWAAPEGFSGQFAVFDLGSERGVDGTLTATVASEVREFAAEVTFPMQPVCYRVEARNLDEEVLGEAEVCTEAPPTTGASPTPGAPTTGNSRSGGVSESVLPGAGVLTTLVLFLVALAALTARTLRREV